MIWRHETHQRTSHHERTAVSLALLHLACSSSGGAVPASNEQPAHSRTSNVGEPALPRVPSSHDELIGRWWGYLPEGQAAVLELAEGEDGALSAAAWSSGTKREGTLRSEGGTIRGYGGIEVLRECSSLDLNTAKNQLECRNGGDTTFVLHRSKAVRILEAEPDSTEPRVVGFDSNGSRFVFGDDAKMFLWNEHRPLIGDLGDRVSGVVFSNDGRYLAYHRRAADSGGVTELMLFDADTYETRFVASRVPWADQFARFSPNGAHLVYFGNCLPDRECDIVWLSLRDGASQVIGAGRGPTPYVVFGPNSERFIFGSHQDAIDGQLLAVDTATKEVQLLADDVSDVTATPDGAWVGFTDGGGGSWLWDAATGEVRPLVSPSSWDLSNYRSGITLSASGRFVALLQIDGHLRVRDTLDEYREPFVMAGLGVHCSSAPGGQPRAVIFAADERGMMSWPRPHDQSYSCDGGIPQLTFRWSEISGEIQLPGVTMGQNPAFGPNSEVLTDGMDISYWSKARGAVSVLQFPSGEAMYLEPGVSFVRDGELVVFAVRRAGETRQLYSWNVDTAKLVELGPTLDNFEWYADPTGGDVVQLANESRAPLNLWRHGHDAATILIDEVTELVPSSSRRAIAVSGQRRDERGVFTYRFGDDEAAWLEAGKVLAVSDSHVFFVAEDGVCVQTF